jgi:endonuclease YncB( thermonuclease family)
MSRADVIPKTFDELLRRVNEVLVDGRRTIEDAWVRTYHEVGRLINTHVLLNQVRAEYGAQIYAQLSEKTGVSVRTLQECTKFHRCFPIARKSAQLGWSHYVLLCQVADAATRRKLMLEAERGAWKTDELEARVRALNAAIDVEATLVSEGNGATKSAARLLTPRRGTPGLHPIVRRWHGGHAVDLGFKLYRTLTAQETRRLDPGDIVRIDGEGFVHWEKEATKAELFTYAATLLRVVDGDTLVIELRLSPEHLHERKLRLRGIDCPELATPEGKAARRFVDGLLAPGDPLVLCTTKPDKYDRYLADVFFGGTKDQGQGTTGSSEIFLNNALLANGHAVRADVPALGDWE